MERKLGKEKKEENGKKQDFKRREEEKEENERIKGKNEKEKIFTEIGQKTERGNF